MAADACAGPGTAGVGAVPQSAGLGSASFASESRAKASGGRSRAGGPPSRGGGRGGLPGTMRSCNMCTQPINIKGPLHPQGGARARKSCSGRCVRRVGWPAECARPQCATAWPRSRRRASAMKRVCGAAYDADTRCTRLVTDALALVCMINRQCQISV
jgi:hypothetical protein